MFNKIRKSLGGKPSTSKQQNDPQAIVQMKKFRQKSKHSTFQVVQGDIISCLPADTIVNAANSALANGGGIDGRINEKADIAKITPEKQQAFQNYCQRTGRNTIANGAVLHTNGCDLDVTKGVLHAVGPNYTHQPHLGYAFNRSTHFYQCVEELRETYRNIITEMLRRDCKSIVLPFISIGFFNFPKELGVAIGIREMLEVFGKVGTRKIDVVFAHIDPAITADDKIPKEVMIDNTGKTRQQLMDKMDKLFHDELQRLIATNPRLPIPSTGLSMPGPSRAPSIVRTTTPIGASTVTPSSSGKVKRRSADSQVMEGDTPRHITRDRGSTRGKRPRTPMVNESDDTSRMVTPTRSDSSQAREDTKRVQLLKDYEKFLAIYKAQQEAAVSRQTEFARNITEANRANFKFTQLQKMACFWELTMHRAEANEQNCDGLLQFYITGIWRNITNFGKIISDDLENRTGCGNVDETEIARTKLGRTASNRLRDFEEKTQNCSDFFQWMFMYLQDHQGERDAATILTTQEILHGTHDRLKLLRAEIMKQLKEQLKSFRKQYETAIGGPSDCSNEERLVRQIGRLNYHLSRAGRKNAEPMLTLYPRIRGKFLGIAEEAEIETEAIAQSAAAETGNQVEEIAEAMGGGENLAELEPAVLIDEFEDAPNDADIMPTIITNNQVTANEMLEEILEQDPQAEEVFGEAAGELLPRVTFISECGKRCPKLADVPRISTIETVSNIKLVYQALEHFANLVDKEKFQSADNLWQRNIHHTLQPYRKCYAGIRSLYARYFTLRGLYKTFDKVQKAALGKNDEIITMIDAEDWSFLPQKLRLVVEAESYGNIERQRHDELATNLRWQKQINATKAGFQELEVYTCAVCTRYNRKIDTAVDPEINMAQFARPGVTDFEGQVRYCKKCRADRRNNQHNGPRFAKGNACTIDEEQHILSRLNSIGRSMIQLVRPIRKMVCLLDKGGRKTTMHGTTGAMIVLPSPTSGTVEHVVDTLPSDCNMNIHVVGKQLDTVKLVYLPEVIEALEWLKANNKHYANIIINRNFTFSPKAVTFHRKELRKPVTLSAAQLKQLMSDTPLDNTLLRHFDFEEQIVRPIDGKPIDDKTGVERYQHYVLQRNPYQPLSIDDKEIDVRAFPWHFPTGRFGMDDPARKRVNDVRQMIRFFLTCKDRRFATDPHLLSFWQGYLEQKDMMSSLGLATRMSRTKVRSGALAKMIADQSVKEFSKLWSTSRSLRGHMAYWDEVKQDLRAHIAIFGPPTWFVTLSPNEKDWEEVLEIYQKVYPNETITRENVFDWISKDPIFFSRHFQQRQRSVFHNLLLAPGGGPLGDISHFFVRLEYQQRGTEHVHCVLWDRNAPSKDASYEEILKYITKHVTARMPCPRQEPALWRIIKNYQCHYAKHSKTCLRTYKVKGKLHKHCRFNFPRPVTPRAFVNRRARTTMGIPGTLIKPYYLARRRCDQMVNDYCPALSLAWGGNTDVQFVWQNITEIINYIAAYTTKNERSKSDGRIQEAIMSASTSGDSFKALADMLGMRVTGMLEVCDTLMGHPLHAFDSDHIFVNTNPSEQRVRMLKKGGTDDQGNPLTDVHRNLVDTYYPNRASALLPYSLINIALYFQYQKKTPKMIADINVPLQRQIPMDPNLEVEVSDEEEGNQNEVNEDGRATNGADRANDLVLFDDARKNPFEGHFEIHDPKSPFYCHPRILPGTGFPCSGGGYLVKLRRPKVPRLFWPTLEINDAAKVEDFHRRLVMLFTNWTRENDMKRSFWLYEETWKDYYAMLQEENPRAAEDISKLIHQHEQMLERDRNAVARRKEAMELLNDLGIDMDPEEGEIETYLRTVDQHQHEFNKGSLNSDQSSLFEEILERIAAQAEWDQKKDDFNQSRESLSISQRRKAREALGERPEAIRKTVLGNAGCGKSFLINVLADELTIRFTRPDTAAQRPAVLLAAPTGLAAVQIRGSTLHSLLGIEVQKGRDGAMKRATGQKLNNLRLLLQNVRLIMIDELSMVSSAMLAKIHKRLGEISGKENKLFGGFNVMLLGDLLQLPAVRANPIYKPLQAFEISRIFGAFVPHMALFNEFTYSELTINQRQQGDNPFADLLSRIRVQQMTVDDLKSLQERVVDTIDKRPVSVSKIAAAAAFYTDLMKEHPDAMALFGTRDEATQFNTEVLKLRELSSITVPAEDDLFVVNHGGGKDANDSAGKRARPHQKIIHTILEAKLHKGSTTRADADGEDENERGGLLTSLVIAEGSRVMLRRNLNAADGLVNGMTGVLRQIECDPVTKAPIALHIKFDRIDQEQRILKVSSVYDSGKDEKTTRRQFPIILAFGCTVHKCQGLTLSAALIQTERFFAPGQAFVALSRVKTFDKLFLTDFFPEKLFCSGEALGIYSRLRVLAGYPALEAPVPLKQLVAKYLGLNPKIAEQVEKRKKAQRRKSVPPIDLFIERSSSPQKKEPKKKPKTSPVPPATKRRSVNIFDSDHSDAELNVPMPASPSPLPRRSRQPPFAVDAWDLQMPQPLVLPNIYFGGSDCFSNAVIQCINYMPELRQAIVDIPPQRSALSRGLNGVQQLLMRRQANMELIRRSLDCVNERGDESFYFITKLFSQISAAGFGDRLVSISFRLQAQFECCGRYFRRDEMRDMEILDLYAGGLIPVPSSCTLRELLEGNDKTIARNEELLFCTECGRFQPNAVDYTFDQRNSRYLMIGISRRTENTEADITGDAQLPGIIPLSIDRFDPNNVFLFGQAWNFLCGTSYDGTGASGHYVCWQKMSNGYRILNDDQPPQYRTALPAGIPHFNLIVLERKD